MDYGDDMSSIVVSFSTDALGSLARHMARAGGGAAASAARGAGRAACGALASVGSRNRRSSDAAAFGGPSAERITEVGLEQSREDFERRLAAAFGGELGPGDAEALARRVDRYMELVCSGMELRGVESRLYSRCGTDGAVHAVSICFRGAPREVAERCLLETLDDIDARSSRKVFRTEARVAGALGEECSRAGLPAPVPDGDGRLVLSCSGLMAREASRACEEAACAALGGGCTAVYVTSGAAREVKGRLGDAAVVIEDESGEPRRATAVTRSADVARVKGILAEIHENELSPRREMARPASGPARRRPVPTPEKAR